MSACSRNPWLGIVSLGFGLSGFLPCEVESSTCDYNSINGIEAGRRGAVQDGDALARGRRMHHHQRAGRTPLRHDGDRGVLGERRPAHGADLRQQARHHPRRHRQEQGLLRQRAALGRLGALDQLQRRADRRGALQVARLGQAGDRLPGAGRCPDIVRLPRREQALARHAHHLPRAGRAGAARQEGQAAALLGGPVCEARLADPRRAASRGPGLLGFLRFDKRIGVVIAANFVAVASRMSLVTFLGIYFVREARIPLGVVGIAFLLENVSRGLLAPLFGALSDRVGRRPLLLASALGTAGVLPCFLLVDGPVSLMAWSLALGVTGAINMPVAGALLLDLAAPERRQAVLAANYTGMSVAYTLGVVPAGYVAEQGYGFLALLSAIGYVCVALLYVLALRGALPLERPRGAENFLSST